MTLRSTNGAWRLALLSTLLALAACASAPAPVQEMAAAEAAVQAGAADAGTPAPAALGKAREKLAAAKRALQAQEHVRARQLAEQAVVDAELAQVTARVEQAEQAAAAMRAEIGAADSPALPPAAGS